MRSALRHRLEQHLDARLDSLRPLGGGCLSSCVRASLSDGRELVIKFGAGHFLLEARMLAELRGALAEVAIGYASADDSADDSVSQCNEELACTSPRVYYADEEMLAMEWIAHERATSPNSIASYNAGCLLACLHSVPASNFGSAHATPASNFGSAHATPASNFGYGYATPVGTFLQDNRASGSWSQFYRERRLLPLAAKCLAAGELDGELHARVLRFAERLDSLLAPRGEPQPCLLHGDLWGGNMLFGKRGLRALIDPALYYGDAQVDLAMLRLFPACDESFFEGYRATTSPPLERSLERLCQGIYSVYPLLLHCLFFGRRYHASLARVLHRYE